MNRTTMIMLAPLVLGACGDKSAAGGEPSASSAPAATATASAAVSATATASAAASADPTRLALQASVDFLKAMQPKRKELAAVDVKALDENTDPNKLLGRPGQYLAKLVWRIEGLGGSDDDATVEFYPDLKGAQARAEYIRKVGEASPMFLQYVYVNEKRAAVLRVPKALTPTQAKAWEELAQSF